MSESSNTFLASQVEATLVMSVRELLDDSSPLTETNLMNLTSFIQASILYDYIYLAGREERAVSPLEVIPSKLKNMPFYKYHNVIDSSERRIKAETAIKNISLINGIRLEGSELGDHLDKTLTAISLTDGEAYQKRLNQDIDSVIDDTSEYAKEGVSKAIKSLDYNTYGHLSMKQRMAIYYWIKSVYNLQLAVDYGRAIFCNYARKPFQSPSYNVLSNEIASSPVLRKIFPSRKYKLSNKSDKLFIESSWEAILPTLLSKVLELAKYDRTRICDAIHDMRNSRDAEHFREHYREILFKKPYLNIDIEIGKDIREMFNRWNQLSRNGYCKVNVSKPFLKVHNLYDLSRLNLGGTLRELNEIHEFTTPFDHLRFFWKEDFTGSKIHLTDDACDAVYKTFGNTI